MNELVLVILAAGAAVWFLGVMAAFGWRAGNALWPLVRPTFGWTSIKVRDGRKPARLVLCLGNRVICRVPFVKEWMRS